MFQVLCCKYMHHMRTHFLKVALEEDHSTWQRRIHEKQVLIDLALTDKL